MMRCPIARVLIGFDVRIAGERCGGALDEHTVAAPPKKGTGRLSFSRSVWSPPPERPEHRARENNINLYHLPDFWGEAGTSTGRICCAAFDIPEAFLEAHYPNIDVVQLPLHVLQGNPRWQFAGFDVVDLFHQVSGLHELGVDFFEGELSAARDSDSELILGFDEALRVADTLNRLRPNNSPFAPCGVWVKFWQT